MRTEEEEGELVEPLAGESAVASPKKMDTKWANQRLEEILGYGKYQYFQVWIFLGLLSFIGAMNFCHLMFLVTKGDHRCTLPSTLEQSHNELNGTVMSEYVKECTTYLHTAETCRKEDLSTCFNTQDPEIKCSSYVYDMTTDDAFWSLASEYDWVCDSADLGSTVMTAQNVGIILSALIFMQLSDSWGRSPVFHITNIIYIVLRLVALQVTFNYWVFVVLIAFGSTYAPLGIRIGYTLVAEYTDEKGRLWVYMWGWVTWVMGVAFIPFMAWFTQEWYIYGIIVPLFNCLLIPFWWLSPESPRLLLTKRKVDEAFKIVSKIHYYNGVDMNEKELRDELTKISQSVCEEKVLGVISLFKSRRLALYTVLLSITWVVHDFLYYSGQLNVENLAGNQFVNFALVGLTELPSVVIGEFLINRLGRRWSQVGCILLTALTYLVIVICLLYELEGGVITGLAIFAKTVSNVGWFIMWVQCVELFPTVVRVTGSNFAAMIANICCTAAPYVILLGDTNLPLMYGVFALVGLLGTITVSFIPETFKQPFPECIEDIERRETHSYFSWRVWNKKPRSNVQ